MALTATCDNEHCTTSGSPKLTTVSLSLPKGWVYIVDGARVSIFCSYKCLADVLIETAQEDWKQKRAGKLTVLTTEEGKIE